jgi:hypothetical protein
MIDMTFKRYWRMLQSKDVRDVSEAAARVEERLAKNVKQEQPKT